MHSRDREWRRILGVIVGYIILLLTLLLVFYALWDFSPQRMFHAIDWSSSGTFATILCFMTLSIAFARLTGQYVTQARGREKRRIRALAGDESAMPVVSIQPDTMTSTIPEDSPFTLRWTNGSTITAGIDGLLWQRPRKRDVLLTWGETHLLELWKRHDIAPRKSDDIYRYGYCLYADFTTYIEWPDAPESLVSDDDLSWEQREQSQEDLLAIVETHTNLPLRVVAGGRNSRRANWENGRIKRVSLVAIIFFVVIAAVPLGAGILSLIAPLTQSSALNLYAAIANDGVSLLLFAIIGIVLRSIFWPSKRNPLPTVATLPSLLVAQDTPAAIRVSSLKKRERLMLLLIGVILTGDIYPVLRALQDYPEYDIGRSDLLHPHRLAVEALLLCVIVGIAALWLFATLHPTTLRADAAGLHWGNGKNQLSIPWPYIVGVIVYMSAPDTLNSRVVLEASSESRRIRWPGDAHWLQPPEDVLHDDAGAQFAAIVAERAGIEPTTFWA